MTGERNQAVATRLIVTSLLLPLWCTATSAQAVPDQRPRSWDLSLWAAGATGEEGTNSFAESQIFSAGILVGKALTGEIGNGWRRGRLEFAADFAPIFIQFAPHRIQGVFFDPVILRWNSSLHRGRVAPFLELGGGGLHTARDFPFHNTSSFNFIARGGGGIQIATVHAQSLEIGCRWWHISNANLGVRNPEFNGLQVSIAWHWLQ
jgi:Lipid A 3-O-deacylase (PagL)